MNNISENQYFLLLKKQKIVFTILDTNNEFISTKEMYFENYSTKNLNELLEIFLEKNIFKVEKNLQSFIKKINIIIEIESFLITLSSIKHNLKATNSTNRQINEVLHDIRNQFKKYISNYEIIHMAINQFIIDGTEYKILPEKINNENLVIQVNFICLNDQITKDLKKVLTKYQISINKFFSYEYLNDFRNYPGENIFKVAYDNLTGLHSNEVIISKKTSKNEGFFQKFFKFFY